MPHVECDSVKRRKVLITDFFQQNQSTDEQPNSGRDVGTINLVLHVESSGETMTKETITDSERAASPKIEPVLTEQHINLHRLKSNESAQSSDSSFSKAEWISSLSPEEKDLLELEIEFLHELWLAVLHDELTKPYFLQLKRFLAAQKDKTVFPPRHQIYSWSHLTPLPSVKCLILGQDPYHNHSQAHGLAFSVLEPTRPPPSLVNIYKTLAIDFPTFIAPNYAQLSKEGNPGGGNLTKWAQRGVLMLNAALTVEAHKANSHAKKGWEQFTEKVIHAAIQHHAERPEGGFVIMAWGLPAQKRVKAFERLLSQHPTRFKVLETVHPSPLSAHRGFFQLQVFKKCNEWLKSNAHDLIDWGLVAGNVVVE